MTKESHFPSGWDEARVRRVLEHYESEEAAVAEDAAFDTTMHTAMEVPADLVPAVREPIAKHRSSA
jgi:hypothetical protein